MRQRPVVLSVFLVSFALFLPLQAEPERAQPVPPGAPPKEMEGFIDDYIAHLCFMVYLNDKIKIPAGDESVYRKAVSAANDFLASKKLKVVLLDQVEKMKKDHTTLVEDAQNENMSVAQWLAQSLNADIYIQLDVLVTSEKRGAQFFAQANLSCKVYDASIPDEVFGSKSYNQLDRSVGSSEELAKSNAVQISVTRIMNEVIRLSQDKMREAVEQGIRYELFLLKAQDADALASFVAKLNAATLDSGSPAVTGIEAVYRTDKEAKYDVKFFGKPEDFLQLVEKTKKTVPGLEGLKLVSQRGKSFTFTTGM